MKRLTIASVVSAIAILALVATTAAAGPFGGDRDRTQDRLQDQLLEPAGDQDRDMLQDRDQLQDRDRDCESVAEELGLTPDRIRELRHEGLSLADIAAQQDVDPERLVEALVARWNERIQVRVEHGALSEPEATALRNQLEARARDLVFRVMPGGMRGAAVGAGFDASTAGGRTHGLRAAGPHGNEGGLGGPGSGTGLQGGAGRP